MTRDEFFRYYGMTPTRAKQIMERFRELVNDEVHDTIAHADFYIDPRPYGYEGELAKEDEDDDGYVSLYEYGEQNSAVKTFMDLISWHGTHGGHTSAIEACRLMGIEWRRNI